MKDVNSCIELMNVVEDIRVEMAMGELDALPDRLRKLRDDQEVIKCDADKKECLCNAFDRVIDALEAGLVGDAAAQLLLVKADVREAAQERINEFQGYIDNEADMEHATRQGYLESITRLEGVLDA